LLTSSTSLQKENDLLQIKLKDTLEEIAVLKRTTELLNTSFPLYQNNCDITSIEQVRIGKSEPTEVTKQVGSFRNEFNSSINTISTLISLKMLTITVTAKPSAASICCTCLRKGFGLMITCKSCLKEFHSTCAVSKQKSICKSCVGML
jgi:hypothetical protein